MEITKTGLIVVKQLPVIEEKLKQIQTQIKESVSYALSLPCNEETYKQIKGIRADLNKDFNELEAQRKEVKKAILKPYNEFEEIYKACITDEFKPAERQLAERIATVENGLKKQKEDEAKAFFDEYLESKNIDFLTFEDMELNITLNASKKSLKDKITSTIDKVADDLLMIETQEHKAEILVEYKKSLNVSQAILTVNNRHKAIEEEKAKAEASRVLKEQQAESIAKVNDVLEEAEVLSPVNYETFSAPKVVEEHDEVAEVAQERKLYKVIFSVETYNIDDLKALKNLLMERGMKYEQL